MTKVSFTTTDYIAWLAGPKSRVEQARQSVALLVNRELAQLADRPRDSQTATAAG